MPHGRCKHTWHYHHRDIGYSLFMLAHSYIHTMVYYTALLFLLKILDSKMTKKKTSYNVVLPKYIRANSNTAHTHMHTTRHISVNDHTYCIQHHLFGFMYTWWLCILKKIIAPWWLPLLGFVASSFHVVHTTFDQGTQHQLPGHP